MGQHRPYKARDYQVAQNLLMLRTRAGLSQGEVADLIGVHRRTIQNWETSIGYPKEQSLQRLVALYLARGVFAPGQEQAEAEALWQLVSQRSSRPLAQFDLHWFAGLRAELAQTSPADHSMSAASPLATVPLPPAPTARGVDWEEAVDVPAFFGREAELATLQQWLLGDRCRLVALLGLGGIGKTSLAILLARQLAEQFDAVVFRSLRNALPPAELLDGLILRLSEQQVTPLPTFYQKLGQLVLLLRERRCLLILDNFETVMTEGVAAGQFRAGFADYAILLQRLAESAHQSCVVLTSREKPALLGPLEGQTAPVRTLTLTGVDVAASRAILADRGVFGDAAAWAGLAHLYGGNPLALKLASEPIRELFGGDLAAFLAAGDAFFNGVGHLLEQQIARLSPLEADALTWLAIARTPLSLHVLQAASILAVGLRERLQALESLRRRFLIELGAQPGSFTLQPVVLEFVTARLITLIHDEIVAAAPHMLCHFAILQATAPAYLQDVQRRVILEPLREQLALSFGPPDSGLETQLRAILAHLRTRSRLEQGYGAGNILSLVLQRQSELHGWDFSHLNVWQAAAIGAELYAVDFRGADLTGSRFTEPFPLMYGVAFRPDGQLLAGAGADGDIRLWHPASGQLMRRLRGHRAPVMQVAWSPDGRLLASAGADQTLRLWDGTSGTSLALLEGHTDVVTDLAWRSDGAFLASSGADTTIRIWEVATGQAVMSLHGHSGNVLSVAWNDNGTMLISAGLDGTIRLWEATTGTALMVLEAATGIVSFALSPDGKMLVSSGKEGMLQIWSFPDCSLLYSVAAHEQRVRTLSWHPDGRQLVSSSFDQTLKVWDVALDAPPRCRATLAGPHGSIFSVAWSPDGDTLAVSDVREQVLLWSAERQQLLRRLQGYSSNINALAFVDPANLFSAGSSRIIERWDVERQSVQTRLRGHIDHISALAISPDGRLLASAGVDALVLLWETASGQLLASLRSHVSNVVALAWRPDGRLFASGGVDARIRLWSPLSLQPLDMLDAHIGIVQALAFSPDGAMLASAGADRTVRLWDVARRAVVITHAIHTGSVRTVAWSPNGETLASAGDDRSVCLWTQAIAQEPVLLHGHGAAVLALAWAPSGAFLVSGDAAHVLWVWEADGRPRVRLESGVGAIRAVAISPDGLTLACAGASGTIELWDLLTQTRQTTLRPPGPFARTRIDGASGLTEAQREALQALGATTE
jgi:WD40 repeat protein/transcriptional regulator with XRE-family HTH domain